MYAQVAVDIAHAAVDRFFTYRIPLDSDIGIGYHVAVPFGNGNHVKEGFVITMSETADVLQTKDILRRLEPYPVFDSSQLALAYYIKETYHCLFIDALRLMIPAQLRGGRVREKHARTFRLSEGLDAESTALTLRSDAQKRVLRYIGTRGGDVPASDIRACCEGASPAIAALLKKGLLTENDLLVLRQPQQLAPDASVFDLTEEQQAAMDRITDVMQTGGQTVLLHGVTGSGKTEVYLQAIGQCLKAGRQAIVLVPEISLTPQTVSRFTGRFPGAVAVLHSKLSVGERFDEWRRIRLGQASIVVGARSAVFAPVSDLGLIVIDEEHEPSYQSDKTPRYHALEIAQKRIRDAGATLILGSATPSLMTYYRAQSGRYTLVSLKERVLDRPLPTVETVDMRDEYLQGNTGIFSDLLLHRLRQCLSSGQQAMLFLNRRGYSTFVSCRSCGYVLKCDHCDVSMTYHKAEHRIKCHYCGAVKPLPEACPNCRKKFIKYFGVGTEQVEEELKRWFPDVSCIRMDTDTMTRKTSYTDSLSAFSRREAQVLIGTQMIAKGHDFPHVTLVGIVSADTMLFLPDFRSEERAFQLITQVSGRAGRDADVGTVVLQTQHPEHPILNFAARHDYEGFFHYEMAERKKALYPPYSLFVRVLFSDADEDAVRDRCNAYARELETALRAMLGTAGRNDLLLLSASPAPIARISGLYRYQIVLKLLRTARLSAMLETIYRFDRDAALEHPTMIEINPQEMY